MTAASRATDPRHERRRHFSSFCSFLKTDPYSEISAICTRGIHLIFFSIIILALALAEHITASSWVLRDTDFILGWSGDGWGKSHKESKRQRTRLYMMYLCHLLFFLWKRGMNHLCVVRHTETLGRAFKEVEVWERQRKGKSLSFWDHFGLYIPLAILRLFLLP